MASVGFQTCGPNEVMVVSGCWHPSSVYVTGGSIFVWPGIQKLQRLSLNTMTLTINTPKVLTKEGVPLSVTGTAQVKVYSTNKLVLEAACELFLGKSELEISLVAKETLEGHQGTVLGDMTVEEILKDRHKFSKMVWEIASADLINMGLHIISYTVKDITDDLMYLKSLGKTRAAQVSRDARIGEAEALTEARIKEALAEQKLQESRHACQTDIARYKRDFQLQRLRGSMQVKARLAQADSAHQLQVAKVRQVVREEEMQVLVVEREQQGRVLEEEVARKERELEVLIRKPAEAERFRLEKMAEAQREKTVLEALAEAEALRMVAEAQAYVIVARSRAEAECMTKNAEVRLDFQRASMTDMVLEMLPKVIAEVAAPLANARKLTLVSGATQVGALKLVTEVVDIVERIPLLVEGLTGDSVLKKLRKANSEPCCSPSEDSCAVQTAGQQKEQYIENNRVVRAAM